MTQYIDKSAVIVEKEYDDFIDPVLSRLVNRNAGIVIAKHFFELELKAKKEQMPRELADEIDALSKRYPEISFAKLSRIAVRIAKWQKEQDKKGE